MKLTLAERFWRHVKRTNSDECWFWNGFGPGATHYPRFYAGGESVGANRVSLELYLGRTLNEGMEACHRCDERGCVNPSHLFEGTHSQNMKDCYAKGRSQLLRPDHRAKLLGTPEKRVATANKVASIRRERGTHMGWKQTEETRLRRVEAARKRWAKERVA